MQHLWKIKTEKSYICKVCNCVRLIETEKKLSPDGKMIFHKFSTYILNSKVSTKSPKCINKNQTTIKFPTDEKEF